jgi:hypothetical protein
MGWVVNVTPRPLYPRECPGNHCIGGWVRPQGRSERVRKILPPPGLDPRAVQTRASRYTDWAIPTHAPFAVRDGMVVGTSEVYQFSLPSSGLLRVIRWFNSHMGPNRSPETLILLHLTIRNNPEDLISKAAKAWDHVFQFHSAVLLFKSILSTYSYD